MEKDKIIKVKEKVVFSFAYQENAEKLILALASSGYYVNCIKGSLCYLVYVYELTNSKSLK